MDDSTLSSIPPGRRGDFIRDCERGPDGEVLVDPGLPDIPCGTADVLYMGPAGVLWRLMAEREETITTPAAASQQTAIVTGYSLFLALCPVVEYEEFKPAAYDLSLWEDATQPAPRPILGFIGPMYTEATAMVRLCEATPERRLQGALWTLYHPEDGRRIVGLDLNPSSHACAATLGAPRRDILAYETLGEPLQLGSYLEFWADDDDNVVYEEGPAYDAFILAESTSERCQLQ
ncbi:MAG TPA: hypothetical protein VJU61_09765 [Polyangiaceae bacterium]|nr:hypothetical protein [Polyangiaceae bacterium]